MVSSLAFISKYDRVTSCIYRGSWYPVHALQNDEGHGLALYLL